MSTDRISRISISGLRVIREASLELGGLTVLIGDNGAGKSTVLEALELLRQAAKPGVSFVSDIVIRKHGGLPALLTRGAKELRLGVTIQGSGPELVYEMAVVNTGTTTAISGEWLRILVDPDGSAGPAYQQVLTRNEREVRFFDVNRVGSPGTVAKLDGYTLALTALGVMAPPEVKRAAEALGNIEVHVPFEVRPLWQQDELDQRTGPRWPSVLEKAGALERYGMNLASVFHHLRNVVGGDTWNRVVDRARFGLGDDLRDLVLSVSGRGAVELEVVLGCFPDQPLPAFSLSEGQLSYLCLVTLAELVRERSALALDEPEQHLHPALLARTVWMLEELAQELPVIVATHSDRLLDALSEPASSVVLCELDEQRLASFRRPNPERLSDWLEHYRGIGTLRAEGYEAHVFDGEPGRRTENEP
jgi:predicted ATPase